MKVQTLLKTFVLTVLVSFSSPLFADYKVELQSGNARYNKGEYKGALKHYASAIQFSPSKGAPYRNMARSYFWLENYAAASAYYDFYLRVALKTEDFEAIKKERKLATERAGSSVYLLPASQKQALTALTQELSSGSAYTERGGGAWALYKALLRSQFAEPVLADLRKQLARRLVDEFDASMIPPMGSFTPVLDIRGWKIQNGRLDAARTIATNPALKEVIARRAKVVAGVNALLSGDNEEAAKLCSVAEVENPDVGFLAWYTAAALIKSDQAKLALEQIGKIARNAKDKSPALLEYAQVLRAIALQRDGRSKDAAGMFESLLTE